MLNMCQNIAAQNTERKAPPALLQCSKEEAADIQAALDSHITQYPNDHKFTDAQIAYEANLEARLIDYHVGRINDAANELNPDTILMEDTHPIAAHNFTQTRLALHRGEDLGLELAINIFAWSFQKWALKNKSIFPSAQHLEITQGHLQSKINNTAFLLGHDFTIMAPQSGKLQGFLLVQHGLSTHFNDAADVTIGYLDYNNPITKEAIDQSLPWYKKLYLRETLDGTDKEGMDARNRVMTVRMGKIQQCGAAHVAGRRSVYPYKGSILAHADKEEKSILAPVFFDNAIGGFTHDMIPPEAENHPAIKHAEYFNARMFFEDDTALENEMNAAKLEVWGFESGLFAQFTNAVNDNTQTVTEIYEQTAALYRQGAFDTASPQ